MVDGNVPLGELLDEQLARTKAFENAETHEQRGSENREPPIRTGPPRYVLPKILEGYVMDEETTRDFLACNDRDDTGTRRS